MKNKNYSLTKSSIISGDQCEKKLWFDINEPKKFEQKANFLRGYRFEDEVRKIYAKDQKVLDLSPKKEKWIKPKERTEQAINSKEINVIFEGVFIFLDTYIRTDILIRKNKGWELLEIKSSGEQKNYHITDLAIQSYILKKMGINLTSVKLIHINKNFIFKTEGDYKDLPVEVDVTSKVVEKEKEIPGLIKKLLPITKKSPCPNIKMGDHCKKPFDCDYIDKCKPKSNIISYEILPGRIKGTKLEKHCKANGIKKLEDVPAELLNENRKIIQDCHKKNITWFGPNLNNIIKDLSWPIYFMDFETVMQGVPKIKGTKPYIPLPFQWSVHKWSSLDKKIKLNDANSFLDFLDQNIERKFAESLLNELGDEGSIFIHSPYEKKVLDRLKKKDSCKDLVNKIDKLDARILDTLEIVRKEFYDPNMNGQYKIKVINKVIPNSDINYEKKDNIVSGEDAELAWFIYTDPKTPKEEKKKQKKLLIDYCSKDTFAVYYLVKYLMEKSKKNKKK
ncbi:MAG: hypothetical protein CNC06_03055 [Pelagibacterales bacterium MED-G40]|nr:MAG: hypothetical protein CNC06_03055 [Pelagibacterales bacterium MED-G40]